MEILFGQSNFVNLCLISLGCGIGYGYLHRIPTRSPSSPGKTAVVPGPMGSPTIPVAQKPGGDGFSEVRIIPHLTLSASPANLNN